MPFIDRRYIGNPLRSFVRYVFLYAFLSVTVFFAFLYFGPGWRDYKIRSDTQQTVGKITQRRCEQHQEVEYAFTAEGKTYRANGMAVQDCQSYQPNQDVVVFYSRSDPTNSINERKPDEAFREDLTPVLLAAILLPFVFLLFFGKRKRR
jgi:hypothetical protein